MSEANTKTYSVRVDFAGRGSRYVTRVVEKGWNIDHVDTSSHIQRKNGGYVRELEVYPAGTSISGKVEATNGEQRKSNVKGELMVRYLGAPVVILSATAKRAKSSETQQKLVNQQETNMAMLTLEVGGSNSSVCCCSGSIVEGEVIITLTKTVPEYVVPEYVPIDPVPGPPPLPSRIGGSKSKKFKSKSSTKQSNQNYGYDYKRGDQGRFPWYDYDSFRVNDLSTWCQQWRISNFVVVLSPLNDGDTSLLVNSAQGFANVFGFLSASAQTFRHFYVEMICDLGQVFTLERQEHGVDVFAGINDRKSKRIGHYGSMEQVVTLADVIDFRNKENRMCYDAFNNNCKHTAWRLTSMLQSDRPPKSYEEFRDDCQRSYNFSKDYGGRPSYEYLSISFFES